MPQLTIKENFISQLQSQFHVDMKSSRLEERYQVLASLVQERLKALHASTQEQIRNQHLKKTIYFSMEFLMGRMITNNLYSLGIYEDVKALFEEHHFDINEVENFESNYSNLSKVKNTIGVASGIDALVIALKALNIGQSDEVIVPSNTYIATWLAISAVGAKIIPVEPDINTFNICPISIEKAITKKTKLIMHVHLYGQ